jgi:YegS/Rv2252/BmrU family lipid kinase
MALKTVAIVNPMASNGRAGELWPSMSETLRVHFPGLVARMTEYPGHARELTRNALETGAEQILVVGGDGSTNEVLCGFVDEEGRNRYPDAVLCVIAAGTGGDFQRQFGRVKTHRQVVEIAGTEPRQVDYGIARYTDHEGKQALRPFLNVASAGLSGDVANRVNQADKSLGPMATYVRGSLLGIMGYRNQQVEIAYDDGPARRIDLTLCAVGNGQYFGGGMWICPQAEIDDALFDVVEVGGMSRRRLLPTLAKVFRGRHLRVRGVECSRAACVELRPVARDSQILLEVDGEQAGRLPARFEIAKSALRLRICSTSTASA